VVVIGQKRGEKLRGHKGKEEATVEKSIDEVRPEDFQALFIPGGHSPDYLRSDERFVKFVRAFEGKPIFAVCHGPQLLLSAEMIRGKTMTAWRTVQGDLKKAGANVVDKEVVVDGNLVTSRQPSDLDAFIRESVQLLRTGAGAHA
jgi:protease I